MEAITDGTYEQVGTFNGNPLTMAAAKAMLLEVLTPGGLRATSTSCARSSSTGPLTRLGRHHLPGYVSAFGAKGAVVFSPAPIRDYRDFCRYDARYGHAHWLYQHNGGVFLPPWGKMEQWTLSVQHGPADVDARRRQPRALRPRPRRVTSGARGADVVRRRCRRR